MLWNEEYKKSYYEVIKKKLPQSFAAMYEKSSWLHDWYLKSLYIANTGALIHDYSARGNSTLQIEFTSGGNDKDIMLIYKNVYKFDVELSPSVDISFLSPTSFGQCISNVFKIEDSSHIYHEFEFEGGRIFIGFKSISYRRIVNKYW